MDVKPSSTPSPEGPRPSLSRRAIAACIIGLLGGLMGLIGSLAGYATFFLGQAGLFPEEYATYTALITPKNIFLPAIGAAFALIGLVGAVVVLDEPKRGGGLMILSAVGGVGAALVLYAAGAFLLIVGAYLSLTYKGRPKWGII